MKFSSCIYSALFVFMSSWFNTSMAQISNTYPHDIGIELDSDVLFVEKFDDSMKTLLSRYTDKINTAGMSQDADVPHGSKGSYSLKMTSIAGINDGGHLFRNLSPGWDSVIYVRYYVKYPFVSKGFIHHEAIWFGGYNPATNWPNPQAGTCGLGDSRFSVSYEPVNEPKMDTYLYWGDMKSWNGGSSCYGNDMVNGSPTSGNLKWDEWICVEVMVKLNNPVTASNGELRVWQDGIEIGYWGPGFPNGHWLVDSWINNPSDPAFLGFRWRTNANLKFTYLWIEYYHDDNSAPDSYIKYDHLVVAKQYIGPLNPGTGISKPSTSQSSIVIYPNPGKGKFTIDGLESNNSDVEIYNSFGEKIFHGTLNRFYKEVDISMQADGIYFLKIKNRETIFTGKIIIQ